jgi:3-oxoacyl-[acyl-carrier protein] reductase
MSRTAIVTGATKGIGKAVSASLLKDGWVVVLTYALDTEAATDTYDEFCELAPGRVHLLQADNSDLNSIQLIDNFLDEHNMTIDAVVFNAGMTDRSDFKSIQLENWAGVFTANVHFPVFLLQKIYPRMNERGSVTFTGSLMAIHPHSVSLAYGVSKASVHALVKNLVKFFKEKKIRINAVAPGFVETEWHKNKPADIRKNITDKLALGRFSTPEEIADVYLLVINNPCMNGEIVVCDGGYSFQ